MDGKNFGGERYRFVVERTPSGFGNVRSVTTPASILALPRSGRHVLASSGGAWSGFAFSHTVVADCFEDYTECSHPATRGYQRRPYLGRFSRKESTMPGWIGPWEIGILVIVLLVVFGPKRLPELGSSLGKAITGFKKGLKESEQEIRKAVAEESQTAEAAKVSEEEKIA